MHYFSVTLYRVVKECRKAQKITFTNFDDFSCLKNAHFENRLSESPWASMPRTKGICIFLQFLSKIAKLKFEKQHNLHLMKFL